MIWCLKNNIINKLLIKETEYTLATKKQIIVTILVRKDMYSINATKLTFLTDLIQINVPVIKLVLYTSILCTHQANYEMLSATYKFNIKQ